MGHRFIADGNTLQMLVRAARGPIKLVPLTGKVTTVPAVQALRLLPSGNWVGKISETGTVRYLREIDKRTLTADPTHWDGRSFVHFQPDQRAIPAHVKRARRGRALGPPAGARSAAQVLGALTFNPMLSKPLRRTA